MLARNRLKTVGDGVRFRSVPAILALGACAAVSVACLSPAAAQDFYQRKTITIVVGYTTGGGYDLNARLLARHIGRHIPGNPTIVVSNMVGAAGLTAVQFVTASAPKDGTHIVTFNFGSITDARLGIGAIKFDFTQFNWLGSISQDLAVCLVWGGTGIKSLEDARGRKELHFGLTAAGSSSNVNQQIVKKIFNLPLHQVSGYPGSAEQRIAVERGELDGQCNPWVSTPVDWIQNNKINALMKFTPVEAPDLPKEVPYAVDVAPTARDAEVIKMLTAAGQLGRPYVLALGVPEERVAILRTAFDATMADPAFVEEAAQRRMDVSPKNAAESLGIVKAINQASESVASEAKKVMEN